MSGQSRSYKVSDLETQQKILIAEGYDLRINNLARFLHQNIMKIPGKLLDVGAGNGLFLRFFKEKNFSVTGIELEKKLVDLMKHNPHLAEVPITQGDITKLKGKPEFDYVLASDVIEHIEDDDFAIHNLWSYVAPGGLLVITVPSHSFLYGKRDKLWGHYRRYDADYLLPKLQKLDGHVVSIKHWNFVGLIIFFIYEKILRRPPAEGFRYKNGFIPQLLRFMVECELRLESLLGGTPFGLTLIVAVRKN